MAVFRCSILTDKQILAIREVVKALPPDRAPHLSSLSMVFLSEGLFFFGGTGGQTFPQISWMQRLLWRLRAAALVRMRSMAVMPSP